MIGPLLRKTWLETRWLLGGCLVLMCFFFWLRVWLVSRLDSGRFQQILELLPNQIRSLVRVDFSFIVTHTGRVSIGFEEPMVVLIMAIWCISRGSDLVSGELSRGTMEMLLAQPISRRRAFFVPMLYALAGVTLLAMVSLVGTWLGVATIQANEAYYPSIKIPLVGTSLPIPFAKPIETRVPMSELVDWRDFWPGAVNLFAVGVAMLGFATVFSAYDRFRWRAIGGVAITLILMSILKVVSMSYAPVAWLGWLSIFSAFEPALFISQTSTDPNAVWSLYFLGKQDVLLFSHWTYNLVLLGLGASLIWHSSRVFERRDLPAPL
ncbi:MAG: ABC transporter permease subunit [Planctomycetaceae bacterium]|nr:ABC transporter permease subunit [Planctomycetaceae bacterium]